MVVVASADSAGKINFVPLVTIGSRAAILSGWTFSLRCNKESLMTTWYIFLARPPSKTDQVECTARASRSGSLP